MTAPVEEAQLKYQEAPESASAWEAPSTGLRLTPLRSGAAVVTGFVTGAGWVVAGSAGAVVPVPKATVRPLHLVHWYMTLLPGSASCFDQAYAVGHFWLIMSLYGVFASRFGLVHTRGVPAESLVRLSAGQADSRSSAQPATAHSPLAGGVTSFGVMVTGAATAST